MFTINESAHPNPGRVLDGSTYSMSRSNVNSVGQNILGCFEDQHL